MTDLVNATTPVSMNTDNLGPEQVMDHAAAGEFWEHLNTAMELARGYTPALSIALQKFQLEHSAAQVAFERHMYHDSYETHSSGGGSGAASPTTMSPTTTPTPAVGGGSGASLVGASAGAAADGSAPTSPSLTGAAFANELRRHHLRDGLRRSIDFCVVAGAAALSRAVNNGVVVPPSAATSTSPTRAASTSSPTMGPTTTGGQVGSMVSSSPVLLVGGASGGGVPLSGRLASPAMGPADSTDAASPTGMSPPSHAPEPLPSPSAAADAPTAMGSPTGSAAFAPASNSSTSTLPLVHAHNPALVAPTTTAAMSATATPDAVPPQPAATSFDGLAQAGSTVLTGDAAAAVEHMMERRVGSFEDLRGLDEDREAQMQRTAELAHACANALAVVFLVPRSDALRRELQTWACNCSVHHAYGYVVNHQPLVAAVAAAANYPYKATPPPSAATAADDADAAVLRQAAATASGAITDDMMAVPPPPVSPLLDFLQAALTVDRNVELTWFAEGYRTMHLNVLSNVTHRCPVACRAVVTSCDVLLQAVLMLARKLDPENPGSMEWAGMVVHHIGAAGLGHEALEHVRRRQQQVAEDAATKMEQEQRMSRVSVDGDDM